MVIPRWTRASFVALAVLLVACAPPGPRGDGQGIGAEAQRPTAPKRILAAIRGDPFTLVDAINSAGGGRVAGVREIEQLLNSGLGLVDNQGQLRPLLADTVPSLQNGLWKLLPDGRMGPQFINPDPPVVADVRFRRALLHALNRQQIIDTFLGGLVPVAHSFVGPDDPDYAAVAPNVVRYDYDPRRAAQLVEEVGYTKGPDGAYRDAGGRRLVVEVRTTAHPLREQLQPVLSDYWQQIGVGMDPVVIPRQRAADREYRATTLGFDFRFNPPEFTRYHSSQVPLPENNYRGNNSARYRSPELDALIERYLVTIPKPERVPIVAQAMRHMSDQLVIVPLFHDAEPVLIHNRLVNVGSKRGDALQPWNAHEWDVK